MKKLVRVSRVQRRRRSLVLLRLVLRSLVLRSLLLRSLLCWAGESLSMRILSLSGLRSEAEFWTMLVPVELRWESSVLGLWCVGVSVSRLFALGRIPGSLV